MELKILDLSSDLWSKSLRKVRHDIYHLPAYLALEAKRVDAIPKAILITEREQVFFLPYLLRRLDKLVESELITQESFDAVSPYGYPGILLSKSSTPEFLNLAINKFIEALSSKQVCSIFIRLHPILNQDFEKKISPDVCNVTGDTISVDLRLSEVEIWQHTRSSLRTKINRCKRRGMTATIVPFKDKIHDFISIYKETMDRLHASKSYYFTYDYFSKFSQLDSQVHLGIIEWQEQIICACLFTECCGIVQYHLGGTRTEFLHEAPSKLMFDYARFWAKERGNEFLHLGGGLGGAKDSLYHFKAGFSKQRHKFLTLRLIANEQKYNSLVNLRAKTLKVKPEKLINSGFFPAYRAS